MDNTALRAARVMNSQSAMLRQRMESSKPQAADEGGMLFKRNVIVPPNTDLSKLLSKWNPGVSEETLEDMKASVCRWNRLKDPEAVREGLNLLIPTVIPHGQDPFTAPAGARPGAAPRPMAPAGPARSPVALSSQMVEQRARSVAQNSAGAATIWATGANSRPLAGADVKQQFQANIWARR